MTPVDDLVAWLTQIWDEWEPNIREAIATGEHGVSQFDLDRIAADRQILAEYVQANARAEFPNYQGGYAAGLEDAVRLLAQPYADREGYQEAWKP